nr:hypothetical protein [Microctonus hyperodae filamentous virus]
MNTNSFELYEIVYFIKCPDKFTLEKRVHQYFDQYRCRGEFFQFPKTLDVIVEFKKCEQLKNETESKTEAKHTMDADTPEDIVRGINNYTFNINFNHCIMNNNNK